MLDGGNRNECGNRSCSPALPPWLQLDAAWTPLLRSAVCLLWHCRTPPTRWLGSLGGAALGKLLGQRMDSERIALYQCIVRCDPPHATALRARSMARASSACRSSPAARCAVFAACRRRPLAGFLAGWIWMMAGWMDAS